MAEHSKPALILSGGGARAAYQVGALLALAELLPPRTLNPFPIICGTSAGAVNAAALAAHPGSFRDAVHDLASMWQELEPADVYRHGWLEFARSTGRLALSLLNRGVGMGRPISMLDNSPLKRLLERHIVFEQIDRNIRRGSLEAVSVTAMSYSTGQSVCFFQADPAMTPWQRPRRVGRRTLLNSDHVMASTAIPTLFPAWRVERAYFGDGALRQLAPLSPALHLGATRIFTIGVSDNRSRRASQLPPPPVTYDSPSMAQVVGHLLNSAFLDSLEEDIERLQRINRLLELLPEDDLGRDSALRVVENLVVSPSEPLDGIAVHHIEDLSPDLRLLLKMTGAGTGGGATTASYLLFTPPFIRELIALGRRDTLWNAQAIERFFGREA